MASYSMSAPAWLVPLMGERERNIINDPKSTYCMLVDPNPKQYLAASGEVMFAANQYERLPEYQMHILDSKGNYFTIDSQRRMIIS